MLAAKSILLITGLVAAAVAGPTREGRQFLPADITGDYNRFVKQGTCAKTVNFTSMEPLAPGGGVYSVPHVAITEDGNACTGEGAFTVITKEAVMDSGNGFILETPPLDTVTKALESQDATFMLGFERVNRVCGPSTTSANTVAVFVEEEKKINIPGLIDLYPGAKYMIVYEPKSPTPCTYFAKYEDRVIGIPSNPSPAPATAITPVTPEPTDDVAEPTSEISAANGADKEPVSGTETGETDGSGAGAVAAGTGIAGSASTDSDSSSEGDVTVDGDDVSFSDEPEPSASEESEDDGSVCFPASATVQLDDGSIKRMDEIELNDRVKVSAKEFSPVFMFTHKTSAVDYSFVRLTTASGASLSLTKGHYLYVNGQLAAAKTVHVGDVLMTESGSSTVSSVSTVSGTGLYNPQTVQGDIIADGVVASTYTTTVAVKAAHSFLFPVRALFDLTGMTTSLFDNGADRLAQIVPSGAVVA